MTITDWKQDSNLNPNAGIQEDTKEEPKTANLEALRQKLQEARDSEKKGIIRKDIQAKADRYIELQKCYKELEARMNKLKEDIQPYMEEKGITELYGSTEGKILLVEQDRPEINSRYTLYELETVSSVVAPEVLSQCTATVIDRYLLENLGHRGIVDKEVLGLKNTHKVVSFTVKKH